MQKSDLADLIHRRRTSLLLDRDRTVPHDVIRELCDLAQWSPNHKRTWPWRFALADGAARERLGNVIAEAMQQHGDTPQKVDKARTKYMRAPAVLVVGSAPGDSPLRTAENRDSVAAGIQNLLLGATAEGLGSYWSSCPKGTGKAVAELCGFEPGTHISGLIYLGWPTTTVEPPARPTADLHVISEY